jgi:hypothetical protein
MKTFIQWLEAGADQWSPDAPNPYDWQNPVKYHGEYPIQGQSFGDWQVDKAVEGLFRLDDEQLGKAYQQIVDDPRWQKVAGVGKTIPLGVKHPDQSGRAAG